MTLSKAQILNLIDKASRAADVAERVALQPRNYMTNLLQSITDMGAAHAREVKSVVGPINECDEIDEVAIDEIRALLVAVGDDRADLASLGYRKEGRDLMEAYAIGWDSEA